MRTLMCLIAILVGCDNTICDPGQRYAHGLCYASVDAGASSPDATPVDGAATLQAEGSTRSATSAR
jgi:hypothetical protein